MTRVRFPWPSLAAVACLTSAGCECGGHVPGRADGASADAATIDAHVEDAATVLDAALEDASLDSSCPDAGGPHVVDDAGACPPGWEPTPAGYCVTDYVPPAVCR